MASVITIAGEQLFAAKAQANEQLDIDTFIFANVPNQDPNAPINREEGIPAANIVYQQNVQQVGRINDNVVVYSTVLDSITGPFEFNWVGLYSSVNQKLVAINHVPTVTKTATAPGAAGNTLNRNFGIEYSGIADLTGITVDAGTWQLDFTARLSGMDLLTQQLAADMNGKDWFIADGLKVVPRTTANSFSVMSGVGYVSGLRVELKQEHILIVQSYPQFVYVDAWFSGNANSTWSPQLAFTVTNTEMDDYVDPSGAQHYVYKLAVINAAGNVDDLRNTDGLAEKLAKHSPIKKINAKSIDLEPEINKGGLINRILNDGNIAVIDKGEFTASDIVPKNSTGIEGFGHRLTTLKAVANKTILKMNGDADVTIKHLELDGLGSKSETIENGIVYDGAANSRRHELNHLMINNFSGYGALFSGGWNNSLKQSQFVGNKVGLGFKVSPQLPGWSGSGHLNECCYFAGNDTAIEMEAPWNYTSINAVIEDCDLPINQTAGGSTAVWINTWFESNKQSPRFAQSNVLIGGRLEGGEAPVTPFYGNMVLPAAPFDYQCITEIVDGLRVFRDSDDENFSVDGQGIKSFKPHVSLGWDVIDAQGTAKLISVGFGSNALGGGVVTETWGNDYGAWKDVVQLTASRHFAQAEAYSMPKLGVKVQAQGSNSLSGLGIVRTVLSSGLYEAGGGGATNYGDRWQVHELGHFSPLSDAAYDIGLDASSRVRDIRVANAPIVGSDVRIKPIVKPIPQELLDFAMSVEIQAYKLYGGKRYHYGIVITPDFISRLKAIQDIDECAAFCKDVFTDSKGNPVDKHLFGEINTIEYLDYADEKLMFKVDFSKDFTLRIGDEVIATHRGGTLNIESPDLQLVGEMMGFYHVYKEANFCHKSPKIKLGETTEDFKLRHDDYLNDLKINNELAADNTPIIVIESGGVVLNDLWQVRYDEWQNILLEAQRRSTVEMKEKLNILEQRINANS